MRHTLHSGTSCWYGKGKFHTGCIWGFISYLSYSNPDGHVPGLLAYIVSYYRQIAVWQQRQCASDLVSNCSVSGETTWIHNGYSMTNQRLWFWNLLQDEKRALHYCWCNWNDFHARITFPAITKITVQSQRLDSPCPLPRGTRLLYSRLNQSLTALRCFFAMLLIQIEAKSITFEEVV